MNRIKFNTIIISQNKTVDLRISTNIDRAILDTIFYILLIAGAITLFIIKGSMQQSLPVIIIFTISLIILFSLVGRTARTIIEPQQFFFDQERRIFKYKNTEFKFEQIVGISLSGEPELEDERIYAVYLNLKGKKIQVDNELYKAHAYELAKIISKCTGVSVL